FFIPALNQDFVLIAKNQRPKSVPFGFEYPLAAVWNFIDSLGEHRQYRGGNRKIHAVPDAVFATRSWSTDSNKGMSDRSVASVRNKKAFSRSRFSVAAKPPAFIAFTCQSLEFSGIDSRCRKRASTAAADFAPQPGNPGKPSAESPTSAR